MPTLAVLVVAYLLSQFYRAFLAVLAPELSADLGLGPTDLGAMSAAWFAAFALAQVPVGLALDSIGPKRTVATLMLAAVAGAIWLGLATTRWECVAALALIGFGCAPVYMGALFVAGRTWSPARFATVSSAIVGIGSLGNLLAATPMAAAMEALGWRGSMLAIGGLTAVSALLVALVARDPARVSAPDGRDGLVAGLADVVRIRALWPLIPLTFVSYAIVAAVRGLWVGPYFAEVHGLDPIARGNAVSVMVIAMIVGAFAYAPLDRWTGTRKWVVAPGTAVAVAGLLALALVEAPSVATSVVLFALVGGFGMTYGVLMGHFRAFLPDHLLGRGITVANFLFIGGAAVLQPISGRLVDAWKTAGGAPVAVYGDLHGLYGLLLLGALAVYLFARDVPLPRKGAS